MRGWVWVVAAVVMGSFLMFNALVVSRGIRSSRLVRGRGNLQSAKVSPKSQEKQTVTSSSSSSSSSSLETDHRLEEAVAASQGRVAVGARASPEVQVAAVVPVTAGGGMQGQEGAEVGGGIDTKQSPGPAAANGMGRKGGAQVEETRVSAGGGQPGGGDAPSPVTPRPHATAVFPPTPGSKRSMPTSKPPPGPGGSSKPGGGGGAFARLGMDDMYSARALPGQSMGEVRPWRPPRPPPNATGARERNEANLQFLHIPKNGGSAITQSGQARGVLWAAANVGRKRVETVTTRNGTCTCPWWHHPPWSLDEELLVSKGLRSKGGGGWSPIFCVVRDPRTRVGSILAQHLQQFIKQSMGDVPQKAEQIMMLRDLFARQLVQDPCFAGCHFVPQHEFVYAPDGTKVCSHVLLFERLGPDFSALMRRFNLSSVVLLDSVNEQHFRKLQWRDLPFDLRKTVLDYYRRDFELFYPGELDKPYGHKR